MKISQREARRNRRELVALIKQRGDERNAWAREYPGGIHIGTLTLGKDWFWGALRTARQLGHAIVVTVEENGAYRFYALPIGAK